MIVPKQAQTAADVASHYDELDLVYREVWGDHVHHGYWATGRESAAQAAQALVTLVAERLELRPGETLCDIGCGYGATAEHIAGCYQAAVTGLTLSRAQAEVAKARVPRKGSFLCLQRDWLANDLASGSFDAAYAIESSEHMEDKARFFVEAARVLRPGGRLLVCAWLARSRPAAWEVRHLLEPICREGRLPGMGSREDYEDLARRAGFGAGRFEDLGPSVHRTWSICARRLALKLVTDGRVRSIVFGRSTKNRAFLLSVPRLILALRTGAMRYGLFVWEKPLGDLR